MSQDVEIEAVGATCFLTMNRPAARNSLTLPLVQRLAAALTECSVDDTVRCVVLRGAGEHFCAGADLRQNLISDPELMNHLDHYIDQSHALLKSVVHCAKPVIAMMDGAAWWGSGPIWRSRATCAWLRRGRTCRRSSPSSGFCRTVGVRSAAAADWHGPRDGNDAVCGQGRRHGPSPLRCDFAGAVPADQLQGAARLRWRAASRRGHHSRSRRSSALCTQAGDRSTMRCSASVRRRSSSFAVRTQMEGVAAWMQKREPVFKGQ